MVLVALFGGDDDDTVGTTGTIECIGRCILQHCHRCHIGRVDAVPFAVVGHAIEHDERIVACVDGTDASDAELRVGIRCAGVGVRLQARYASLQGIHHVVHLTLLYQFHVNHIGRARK